MNETTAEIFGVLANAGGKALDRLIDKAIPTPTEATEIRLSEQDKWQALNGSGPNDRSGAAMDAATGSIYTKAPAAPAAAAGFALSPAMLGAIVFVVAFLVLKRK
jgi:hypothetical protein